MERDILPIFVCVCLNRKSSRTLSWNGINSNNNNEHHILWNSIGHRATEATAQLHNTPILIENQNNPSLCRLDLILITKRNITLG